MFTFCLLLFTFWLLLLLLCYTFYFFAFYFLLFDSNFLLITLYSLLTRLRPADDILLLFQGNFELIFKANILLDCSPWATALTTPFEFDCRYARRRFVGFCQFFSRVFSVDDKQWLYEIFTLLAPILRYYQRTLLQCTEM